MVKSLYVMEEIMSHSKEFVVVIHLVQGDSIAIKSELSADEQRNLGSAIESGMDSKYLGVEFEGKLHIFPMHNIRSIEIDPAPKLLIKSVIQGAKRIDSQT